MKLEKKFNKRLINFLMGRKNKKTIKNKKKPNKKVSGFLKKGMQQIKKDIIDN